MIEVLEKGDAVTFAIRVQPRASRNAIAGEWNGALKIRLTAPPLDGRANDAACRLLADQLNIPLSAVSILSGERSRTKRVRINGVDARRIQELAAAPAK